MCDVIGFIFQQDGVEYNTLNSNLLFKFSSRSLFKAQEVGGTLFGKDRLAVMAGTELVEWCQIHQTHGFHVFDSVPFAPFWPLL